MERVTFIIEETGERLGCLLNPESLLMRRRAGIEPRRTAGGLVTGAGLADDPVFFTGGGTTELTLDLVFDVSLAGSSITAEDVRELTGPLWELAENARRGKAYGQPPLARFVWGKAWNVPGVVTAVAERLEYFTPGGTPQRAWLRLRMIRVAESATEISGGALAPPSLPTELPQEVPPALGEQVMPHEITGGFPLTDAEGPHAAERLDQLAQQYYGDSSLWRLLAWANGIADPLRMKAGQLIQIPTGSDLEGSQ